jgi:hypothetical protein
MAHAPFELAQERELGDDEGGVPLAGGASGGRLFPGLLSGSFSRAVGAEGAIKRKRNEKDASALAGTGVRSRTCETIRSA